MSARLSRKDIKRDDFATAVERSVEYAEAHTRMILYAIGAGVVLAALVFGIRLYFAHRSALANTDLAYAIKVYSAPANVTPANTAKPKDKENPTFPDEASRNALARKLLRGVREHHRFTDAADIAGLYLAQMAAAEGKLDVARALWTEFVDHHKDSAPAVEAQVNLFDLDRRQGKSEALVGRLSSLVKDSSSSLPKDIVLYQLALTYEKLQRRDEAARTYQQILDEYPQSGYRQDAQQKIAALDPSRANVGSLGSFNVGGPGAPLGLQ